MSLMCFNDFTKGDSPVPQDILVGRVYSYDNIYKVLILSKLSTSASSLFLTSMLYFVI